MGNVKDLHTGLLFAGVGGLYGTIALRELDIGSALDMGPGYFPLILAGALVVVGLLIAAVSLTKRQATPFGPVPWRAALAIAAAIIFFALFIRKAGMFPGTFATAFIASLASPVVSLPRVIIASLAIAALCTAVFSFGVGLPIPIIGNFQ